jgi:ABC-type branched-subunit amino acid transport system substrate-binding protein
LDRYRIVAEVGRGGHGAVYLCEDLRLEGRLWAVKELHSRGERLADFEREASILSQLEHPRIPVIVDFFVQDGNGYLVREYLDGPTLYDLIEHRGPISEAQALQWGMQIAEVLTYLHQRQPPLYHRDLKPANVVLLADGLRLMDFGLAREASEKPGGESGSVSFTAPEQFSARHQLGPAADIYSLGAVLYYMLMGVPPGPTGGEHRLLPQRPQLQAATEQTILHCLHPDPDQRPRDVAEVLTSLQYNAARLPPPPAPILPMPANLASRPLASPPAATRWTLGWAILPLVVVLIGAGALVTTQSPGQSPTPVVASPGAVSTLIVEPGQIEQYMNAGRFAEAEGALKGTLAAAPDSGWARLFLFQLPLRRRRGALSVPLLLPLGGQEQEHVNWILQGVALGQQEEKRFFFDLVDTHATPVLSAWQKVSSRRKTPLVLGPFGSQEALLVAPLAAGSGVPMLPIGSTDPRVQDAGASIFPVGFPHTERIAALLGHAVEQLGEGGQILYSAESKAMSASGQLAADQLRRLTGSSPTLQAYSSEESAAGVVAQVRSSKPHWIYLADNLPVRAAAMIRELRRGGVAVPVICVFHPASEGFREALQDTPGQVWLVEPLWQDHCREFVERWRAIFPGRQADWNSALGYDVARLASRVWGSQQVLAELQSLADYHGLLGVYNLRKKTFQPHRFPFRVVIFEDGDSVPGAVLPGH